MFEKEELKPIDPSKYKITETGQVLKMTKEELEREKCELLGIVQGKDKVIQELEKENAELKKQVENRNCSNCRLNKTGCPNDGSCHNFSLWQPFINPKLTKAKEIIKKFLEFVNNEDEFDSEHPQEHTDLWNELCEKAEQFISELEK